MHENVMHENVMHENCNVTRAMCKQVCVQSAAECCSVLPLVCHVHRLGFVRFFIRAKKWLLHWLAYRTLWILKNISYIGSHKQHLDSLKTAQMRFVGFFVRAKILQDLYLFEKRPAQLQLAAEAALWRAQCYWESSTRNCTSDLVLKGATPLDALCSSAVRVWRIEVYTKTHLSTKRDRIKDRQQHTATHCNTLLCAESLSLLHLFRSSLLCMRKHAFLRRETESKTLNLSPSPHQKLLGDGGLTPVPLLC